LIHIDAQDAQDFSPSTNAGEWWLGNGSKLSMDGGFIDMDGQDEQDFFLDTAGLQS